MKVIVVDPSLKLKCERVITAAALERIDAKYSVAGKAVYIHGDKSEDIVAFMMGAPDADQSCCVVEGTVLDRTCALVGLADADGETFCDLSMADVEVEWCTKKRVRSNLKDLETLDTLFKAPGNKLKKQRATAHLRVGDVAAAARQAGIG